MCGIFAVFDYPGDIEQFRPRAISLSKRIRHRGPDWTGVRIVKNNILCHERLAIVGVDSGAQPLTNHDDTLVLCVNGEIYNHIELREKVAEKRRIEGRLPPFFKTGSDCEVILHLYEEFGDNFLNYLDGMFSFVLYDSLQNRYIAARDPIGIIPLYQGWSSDGSVWFASELKSIFEDCSAKLISFEPGTLFDSVRGCSARWYRPVWWSESWIPSNLDVSQEIQEKNIIFDEAILISLKETLENAVRKQLMSEVPFGVLLSGGLDSSLIAAIAARQMTKTEKARFSSPRPADNNGSLWSSRLHTFSIGLTGSPDLLAARVVADHIGTIHHEFTFTVEEGIDAVRDVIYHLETYDVTTIRASTPMFLLSRKIKATGVKMVLSGEGSDEIFGGYLYFHQAPSPSALHEESVKRVKLLHTSDCLRANKSTMAWGLEARVPFLDTKFLDFAMTIPPEYKHPRLTKRKLEKEILRQAFDVSEDDGFGKIKSYLPADILWRQKEQFSDGVGYSWIDLLKQHAESNVIDAEWSSRSDIFPFNTPSTKEALFYRRIFEEFFCPITLFEKTSEKLQILSTVVKWIPRQDWGCSEDPSGRAQKAHTESYDNATP